MNAFHSTNLFCCFSRYQAPANSVAPPSVYKPHTTHNSSICSDDVLNFAKSCVLACLSKVDNIKKFHRAVFEL